MLKTPVYSIKARCLDSVKRAAQVLIREKGENCH